MWDKRRESILGRQAVPTGAPNSRVDHGLNSGLPMNREKKLPLIKCNNLSIVYIQSELATPVSFFNNRKYN